MASDVNLGNEQQQPHVAPVQLGSIKVDAALQV
jgi:hypothetical protein